jgi:radical SAM superfamily enzyme YgiQ (UPF0313 family)
MAAAIRNMNPCDTSALVPPTPDMKIALVYPPFSHSIRTTLPEFVKENEGCFPPLGIMYVASFIRAFDKDCEILLIDAVAEKLDHAGIQRRLESFAPDVVGVSCWTFSLVDSLQVAERAKHRDPRVITCLGGPHVTIYPLETAAFPAVDFAITGDGERAFTMLIRELRTTRRYESVPNLFYKESGAVRSGPIARREDDLDALPHPDRSLTPLDQYTSLPDGGAKITTMVTSRGCPFQCTFCFQQGTRWRYRSVENIISEIAQCASLGIRKILFFDETFTVNRKRVLQLCGELEKRNLPIRWSCRSRVDTIDEEMMDAMVRAGCTRISFGVESGDDEVLRRLNKKISIDQARRVFSAARERRITTLADFMIGCPGETRQETMRSIELAVDLEPDYVQFTQLTLFPATPLYREALASGVVPRDVWKEYAERPSAEFTPPVWNAYSPEEARELLALAYRRFYLRPRYVLRKFFAVRSYDEFRVNAQAATSLLQSVLGRNK